MHEGSTDDQTNFTLQPALAEILRTCIHPDTVRLRIEIVRRRGVADDDITTKQVDGPENVKIRDVRLFLTDGQLVVQAYLHGKILETDTARCIGAGDFLDVYKFAVKKAVRKNGDGSVVYLVIHDCHILTTHSFPVDTSKSEQIVSDVSAEQIDTNTDIAALDSGDVVGKLVSSGTKSGKDVKIDYLQHAQSMQSTALAQPAHGKQEQIHLNDIQRQESADESELMIDNLLDFADGQGIEPEYGHTAESQDRPELLKHPSEKLTLKRKNRDESSEDEAPFETMTIDTNTAYQRRKTLLEMDQHKRLARPSNSSKQEHWPHKRHFDDPDDDPNIPVKYQHQPVVKNAISSIEQLDNNPSSLNEIRPHTGQQVEEAATTSPTRVIQEDTLNAKQYTAPEPPLHNLASLLNPPKGHPLPRKNYTLNTFAVITHVGASLISRPGSSFPPKRHIKIEDPSLHHGKYQNPRTRGVTVAVYRNAPDFKPEVGTIALFRGLVMQRLPSRDIILNVYPAAPPSTATAAAAVTKKGKNARNESIGKPTGTVSVGRRSGSNTGKQPVAPFQSTLSGIDDWFVTSPSLLAQLGHDVDGMRSWWQSRQKGAYKMKT